MNGAHVPLHTDFGTEFAVCKEMHWSVADLHGAPARMVDEIVARMSAEREWTAKRDKLAAQKRKSSSGGKKRR